MQSLKLKKLFHITAVLSLSYAAQAHAHFDEYMSNARAYLSTYTLDCGYWYAGAGLGVSHLHDRIPRGGLGYMANNGPGWTAYGGYRFNSLFGVELGYNQYYQSRHYVPGNGFKTLVAYTNHFSSYIAGVGHFPIYERFSGLVKLGFAYSYAWKKYTTGTIFRDDTFRPFYGLGLAYSINPRTDLVWEWTEAAGNKKTGSADLFTLGFVVGFA